MRGNAGIVWERPQIESDVRGASLKGVKIERKFLSGKGLVVPSKSTTSSLRFGRENGRGSSWARVRSCNSPIKSVSGKRRKLDGSPPKWKKTVR